MKSLVMYGNPTVEENIKKFLNGKVHWEVLTREQKAVVVRKLEMACKSCSLHYETKYQNVPAVLNPNCKYVFIGRNPNGVEAISNSMFPDGTRNGEIFQRYLSILGIGKGEISELNMCYCYGLKGRPVTQEEINKCVAYKSMELEAIGDNFRVIFAMGQDALKWIYGLNHPGAMQCVGDIFESEYNGRIIKIVPLLHPSQIMIQPELGGGMYEWLTEVGKQIVQWKQQEDW